LFVRQADLPEGVTRLPIKTIHINKSPFVVSSLQTLSAARAQHWGIDVGQQLQHAERLRTQGAVLAGLWEDVFAAPAAAAVPPDPEANLYGGFVADADRKLLVQVRGWGAAQLAQRVQEGRVNFADARLNELLWRFRARHHPAHLSEEEAGRWLAQRARRVHDGEGGGLPLANYLDRLDGLQAQHEDEASQALLEALVDWAEAIAPPHPEELPD
jgi:exodeoxyribonuclease-1